MKDSHRLKIKGGEKIFDTYGKGKKAGVAVLISDKIEFKTNAIIRDKEGYYVMIKEAIQQEDITFVKIYALNIEATNYIKELFFY